MKMTRHWGEGSCRFEFSGQPKIHGHSHRLIAHLRHLGHDVSAISQDHPHSLADEDVLAIARDEQRILVVADRDFGELIFHQGLAHAGIIFFRLPGALLQTKVEHLDSVLEEHADALTRGEFLVVSPGQIRVANRPRS
jgi:predicted nuclease of predicted toxin-antitoxin system